ncbi:ATP-binding protein [Pseudidiomarina aestuarii]|uniref:histidine kinase n=1 Tax=Pseudidiomarina aestuarii TaxID=624146 RepID=A0A2T4D717_9GAMM|nr:ATP-binding protein [Pseudidiomarina aestuarii]PTB89610.1 ATP-binding protein [Pseudidiomarina aestuarii]
MTTTSISKSLLTSVLSVYFVLTVLVTAVQVVGEYYDTQELLVEELRNQQATFSNSLGRSLWEYNYPQIDAIAQGLISIPAISGVVIRDDTGAVLANLGRTGPLSILPQEPMESYTLAEREGLFGYFSTLVFEFSGNSTQVGDVTLFSTRDIAIDRIKVTLYFIFGSALVKSTFLILLFSLAFNRMLNRPMLDLTNQIRQFRLEDLPRSKIHLKNQRNREFTMIEQAYNQLLDNLADYQADLTRTQQQFEQVNRQLDDQNAILEQEVARKTSSLSGVLVDLERRKSELEARQEKLEREIRQRQEIERDLRETNTRLQNSLSALERAQTQLIESEKMASLGGLVAGITHDVNTPIGVSITAATFIRDRINQLQQALKDKNLTQAQLAAFLDESDEGLTLLENNLTRASDLIGSFKQVAVDQTSEAVREINLKKYLQDVIQALQPHFKNSKHVIQLDIDSAITIRCPAGAIAQIFTNLIQNSLIHGFENQSRGEITIQARRDGDKLLFNYSDNGKGLTQEQLEKIFDPFFTTRRQHGGTGLGTHIVRNLVTQTLNGVIHADAAPGKGLKYTFEMPMQFIDSTN